MIRRTRIPGSARLGSRGPRRSCVPGVLWAAPALEFPILTDHSGGGNHGTMTNMERSDIQADVPAGPFSIRSCDFDGVDEYVTMGDVLGFERDESHSWALWVKAVDLLAIRALITKSAGATAYTGYSHVIDVTGEVYFSLYSNHALGGNYLQVRTTNAVIGAGAWTHVVYTYDGSSTAAGVKVYIDSVSQAMTTVHDNLFGTIANAGAFQLGKTTDAVYFKGKMDSVGGYDKELTQADVNDIYNAGVPNNLRLREGSGGDLVAWWRMGEAA